MEGLTGLYYVKMVLIPEKNRLIDFTQDKMAILGHIMTKFGTIYILYVKC